MKRMKKGIAMFLAAFMVVTSMPAYAEENVSEGTEQVAETEEAEDASEGEIRKEAVSETEEAAETGNEVCFNTGNHVYHVVDAALFNAENASVQADAAFDADGSYTINIPEENPFFPYEVQFTYQGETTEQWFMTPEDTIEIGGHTFRVSAYFDNSAVTQMTLNVAGKKVVVYPEKKEFTNDGDGTMELSLLPLETRELTVDLTEFTPVELTMVSTDIIFTGENQLTDTEEVLWQRIGDDTYKQTGNKLNLACHSMNYDMMIGTADQLDSSNVRYTVRVNTKETENWLIPSLYMEDENGNREQEKIIEYAFYDDYIHGEYNYLYAELISDSENYNKKSYISLQINPEVFDTIDNGKLKVYEGNYQTVEEINPGNDITEKIFTEDMSVNGAGYQLTGEDFNFITLISYDESGNITGFMPMNLEIWNTSSEGQVFFGGLKRTEDDTEYMPTYSDWYSEAENGQINYEIELYKGYKADSEYYVELWYMKYESYHNDMVTAAYAGTYNSISEAQAAGAADIKDSLFNTGYENGGYPADYSKGIDFTAFIGEDSTEDQEVYHFNIKLIEGEEEEEIPNPTLSEWTGVTFQGIVDKNGQEIINESDTCVVGEHYDSYAEHNYWTILTSADTDLTAIAPLFTADPGVTVYAAGTSAAEESGVSVHDFSKGPLQYTAVAEDGVHSKNYWLSIVKATEGTNLYITSMADEASHTKTESGVIYSDREIMLDDYHSNVHDIFVTNMGKEAIENISVELDADMLQLDDYWTLSGKHELSGYDGNFEYSDMYSGPLGQNFAKIRLRAKDSVVSGTEISGTLKIKSGEDTLMVLNLTGLVGSPTITTAELPEATKFVPYGTVIQNNNKYHSNNVTYEVLDGELPDGMELRSNGEIYGMPLKTGEFTFIVRMNNSMSSLSPSVETFTLKVAENTNENVEKSTDKGYEIKESLNDVTIGDNGSQTFVSNGEFDEFQDVYLDGQKLTKDEQYKAEKGSTRITIAAQTLAEGGEGSHTIALEFRTRDTNSLKRAAQNYMVTSKKTPENNGDDNKDNSGKTDDTVKPDNNVKPDGSTKPDNSGTKNEQNSTANDSSQNSNSSNAGSSNSNNSSSSQNTAAAGNQTTSNTTVVAANGPQKTITYTVEKGDTLSKIALQVYGDRSLWRKIYEDNKNTIKNPNLIHIGQQLTINFGAESTETPQTSAVTANSYVMKPGDTLWKIAKKLYGKGTEWIRIFEANKNSIKNPQRIRVGRTIALP